MNPGQQQQQQQQQPRGQRKASVACGAYQRRKIANQRNIQHLAETRLVLERYQQLIGGIVAILRADDDGLARDLVNAIRSDTDLSQLAAHVRNVRRDMPNVEHAFSQINFSIEDTEERQSSSGLTDFDGQPDPSLQNGERSTTDRSHGGSPPYPRKKRIRTGRIEDMVNPPVSIPAKPWTTVTDDDDFVSHLISLWFTWAHPWWHWVDEHVLLEAMRNGDVNDPICSPFLVNMILADSCLLDALDENDSLSNTELRDQFYAEALKGLDAADHRTSLLTIVQTMGVQWTYLVTNGQDKHGHTVLHEQHKKSKDLDQWRANIDREGLYSAAELAKIDTCLDNLAWTMFALDTISSMSSGEMSPPPPPSKRRPANDHRGDGPHTEPRETLWLPYPEQKKIKSPFHYQCHFGSFLSLAEAAAKDESMLPQGHTKNDPQIYHAFYKRFEELEKWSLPLPPCMQLGPHATPHVITLHALHYWVMLSMCKEVAAAEAGHASQSKIMSTGGIWHARALNAARAIGNLMLRMYREWGHDHFPVIITQPVSLALFALLDHLHEQASLTAFVSLCYTMHAAARRYMVGKGVMRLLQQTAWDRGIQLPSEVMHLFYTHSIQQPHAYPGAPPEISVDYLLGKWDDFNIK
ncbi:hypothetical protein LTS08_005199 [Lithohypha guttulata]|nr:hypothetical protein LTS08_005199 [Lithohypha guttulata]